MAKRTRPVDGVNRRYAWKLYPTPEQDLALRQQAAMCADLWNALLRMCEDIYERGNRHGGWVFTRSGPRVPEAGEEPNRTGLPSEYDMGYWITAMLDECPEWRALSTWTPRRVATSLSMAYKAFFRRAREGAGASSGYPKYKSRRRHLSIPHRCDSGCAMNKSARHDRSYELRLKGVDGSIWARGMLPAKVSEYLDVDVMFRDGHWEASIAVAIERRRVSHQADDIVVRFDLLDCLAQVNGVAETPDEIVRAQILQDHLDALKSETSVKWPRGGRRYSDEEWTERCEDMAEIGRLSSYIARVRKDALHVWTTRIVARARSLTIIKPAIRLLTKSPRGDKRDWGAEVEIVSDINRNTLSYAPALAVQMLEYKAKEAGITCEVITDEAPKIEVGNQMVVAAKAARRIKRNIRRIESGERTINDTPKYRDRSIPAGPFR